MTHPRATLAGVTLLLLSTAHSAWAQKGYGYAWANSPAANAYTPHSNYSFNASGQPIAIKRSGTGRYSVRFKGMGGQGGAGGHVQVTAYGPNNHYCKVVQWDSGQRDFVVKVACFNGAGRAVDSQYTIQVSWPRSSHGAKTHGTSSGGTGEPAIVSRQFLPNGHVKITFSDGTIEERFSGGKTVTRPGQPSMTMMYSTQAPPAIPPAVPDNEERSWLAHHNDRLLETIRTLVGNDQAAMDNYSSFEQDKTTLYEQIAARRQTIDYLIRP